MAPITNLVLQVREHWLYHTFVSHCVWELVLQVADTQAPGSTQRVSLAGDPHATTAHQQQCKTLGKAQTHTQAPPCMVDAQQQIHTQRARHDHSTFLPERPAKGYHHSHTDQQKACRNQPGGASSITSCVLAASCQRLTAHNESTRRGSKGRTASEGSCFCPRAFDFFWGADPSPKKPQEEKVERNG